MKVSSIYPYRGVVRSASGEVLEERGYFSLHAARRSVVLACAALGEDGQQGVTAEIYRGRDRVSEFSILDQGAA